MLLNILAFLHLRVIAVVEGLIALGQGKLASLESRELLPDCRVADWDWRDVTHLKLQVLGFNIFLCASHCEWGPFESRCRCLCQTWVLVSGECCGGGKYLKYLSFSDGFGEIFR